MTFDRDELRAAIATHAPGWLPNQRWFAGKGRELTAVEVIQDALFEVPFDSVPEGSARAAGAPPDHDTEGAPPWFWHVIARVTYGDGGSEVYQLLVGLREHATPRLEHAHVDLGIAPWTYSALQDPVIVRRLVYAASRSENLPGSSWHGVAPVDVNARSTVRPLGVEQSNSSVVVDERHVLKVFRRLSPGINPDLEVTRALGDVGSKDVIPLLGWADGELSADETGTRDPVPTTLAMIQPYLSTATEGWRLATTSLRDLYAEGDLYADEVGGDFAAEASRLGAATARVHAALARAFGTEQADDKHLAEIIAGMRTRLDDAVVAVPELAEWADRLARAFDEAGDEARGVPVVLQRIHGDLHLGQVVRSDAGWLLIDFEGEPVKTLAERRAAGSPLQDVAGMMRSFDYAAHVQLVDAGSDSMLRHRAAEWVDRNRTAFREGYIEGGGADPGDNNALLRALELDKAVYEAVYETRHRPQWIGIPLGAIERLVG